MTSAHIRARPRLCADSDVKNKRINVLDVLCVDVDDTVQYTSHRTSVGNTLHTAYTRWVVEEVCSVLLLGLMSFDVSIDKQRERERVRFALNALKSQQPPRSLGDQTPIHRNRFSKSWWYPLCAGIAIAFRCFHHHPAHFSSSARIKWATSFQNGTNNKVVWNFRRQLFRLPNI